MLENPIAVCFSSRAKGAQCAHMKFVVPYLKGRPCLPSLAVTPVLLRE